MFEFTLDNPAMNTNLPARLIRFIGRTQELELLTNWLLPVEYSQFSHSNTSIVEPDSFVGLSRLDSNNPVRILTFTGAGGSGKTALAIEVARRLLSYYPGGIWLIELAALSDPALLTQTVASTLGLVESNDRLTNERLLNYLRSRQILLILDNCEHLVEEVARLITSLSELCPGLRILATSREALNIEGEQQWQVRSLSLPPFQTVPPLVLDSLVSKYEAVDFFVERARAVVSTFELTIENADAIVAICQYLDGLPLALELAVARLKFLTVAQLSTRLEHSFKVLTAGRRTALPRQQTLEATLEWSHNLLSFEEQLLFRRLAVFAGGFTLEAAEAVVSDEKLTRSQVLDLLGRLIDKSLVSVDYVVANTRMAVAGAGQGKANLRYRLLEMVRQYAAEKLQHGGELTECQQRHSAYYLNYAEQIELRLFSADQQQLIKNNLWPELANLRATLKWEREQDNDAAILSLAGSLWFFWLNGGLVSEGREWLAAALPSLEGLLASVKLEPRVAAKALRADGQLAWVQGRQALALNEMKRSVSLYEKTDDHKGWAFSSGLLTIIMLTDQISAAELSQAQSLATNSVAAFRELDDRWCLANALLWLGNIKETQKAYEQAGNAFQEAIELFRELKETLLLPLALSFLAQVLFRLGEPNQSVNAIRESLLLRRETGEKWYASMSVEILSQIVGGAGLFEAAAVLYGAAESLRQEINVSVLPLRRSSYAENIALVQAKLDKDTFELALTTGRNMSLDQLVEFVLNLEPDLVTLSNKLAAPPARSNLSKPHSHTDFPSTSASSHQQIGLISQRELEILKLVAQGATSQEIASSLIITPGTVKWHLSNIYSKIGAKNRTQAVALARKLGLLSV